MIVIDGSAVVDLLAGLEAEPLRRRLAGERLHAPPLVDHEVVAGLRRLTFKGILTADDATNALSAFEVMNIKRWPFDAELRARAFQLRHTIGAYDAPYVALAEALECPLVTRDAQLARSHGHEAAIELH